MLQSQPQRNPPPENGRSVAISTAGPDDIDAVRRLAHEIWHRHYPGIITAEQIEYMLERGYSREALIRFVAHDEAGGAPEDRGIALARVGEVPVGFVAWCPADTRGVMKLERLYILPEYHGKGIGRALIEHVVERARAAACRRMTLNVNRNNTGSIRVYERCGFAIAGQGDFPIGGGFVMEDFIMEREL